MGKRRLYSDAGKRDLLNKDYNSDQKFTLTTYSPTGVDEDFVIDKDDGGSPTDDSGEGESHESARGDEEKEAPMMKKIEKEPSAAPKASSSSTKKKGKEDDGSKKKKQKPKKDSNAPKRAITAFLLFCQTERENVKKSNHGISIMEMGKELGDRWNKMTADDKSPYEAKAREDKKRYNDEISGYKNVDSADATEGA